MYITHLIAYCNTVVSRYYDTAGVRKKYHYIQTIEISSINFYCFVIVGILIWYRNKQHFELLDMVTRDYCMVDCMLSFCVMACLYELLSGMNLCMSLFVPL